MGYDVHISRRENWSDDVGPTITLAEWRAAASNFTEFVYIYLQSGNDCEIWMMESGGSWFKFWHDEKYIFVKNPPRSVLARMGQLAKLLKARTIGEEDEVYDKHGYPDRPTEYKPREW